MMAFFDLSYSRLALSLLSLFSTEVLQRHQLVVGIVRRKPDTILTTLDVDVELSEAAPLVGMYPNDKKCAKNLPAKPLFVN